MQLYRILLLGLVNTAEYFERLIVVLKILKIGPLGEKFWFSFYGRSPLSILFHTDWKYVDIKCYAGKSSFH